MSDTKIPQKAIDWMNTMNWGDHHDEWHYTRRFHYWPRIAQTHPDPAVRAEIQAMVDYATLQNWSAAQFQEGAVGSGLDFLAMHRAMLHLLIKEFPDLIHFFRGWETPPTDPTNSNDPVPDGSPFDAGKNRGLGIIEGIPSPFLTDDEFGRYLETPLRPTASDPTARDPNPELGIHNYLHNRWSIDGSDVNLGDPKVNIFNTRFWRLHGWIDYQWWRFRQAKQFDDNAPEYRQLIDQYIHMMGHPMHHDHHTPARPKAFSRIFAI